MSQDSSDTDDTSSTTTDPLNRVAIATNVWRKAAAARDELAERNRAIFATFDAGRTGTEIAAASGLDLAEVYRVHRRAGSERRVGA